MSEAIQQAFSSLSYLKMITPKSSWKEGEGGITRLVIGSDDKKGRVVTNWHGKNLDPESVSRHKHTLKRAGFMNNRHAKGVF